jgi:hypothetical protein
MDDLAAAYCQSCLPIMVQILGWERIPPFCEEIEAGYMVI